MMMLMAKIAKNCKLADGLKPVLVMVIVQVGYAGLNVLYKLAASNGMSVRIIIAYRFIFATAFMAPLALFFERNIRPKFTWIVLFQAFLCGLFGGALAQNMFLESVVLTSVTFAAAMFNLVPAVTFILAISFGLEKVGLRTQAGKAKIVGTLTGITGAMLLTFYKGVEIKICNSHFNLLKHYHSHNVHLGSSHHANQSHILGSFLAVANCLSYALWLIIQAKMSARYPCPYSSTALMSLMASTQTTIFALCMEKNWSQWKLGWNIRLLTVAYAGVIVAGVSVTMVTWCVRVKGPLFVSSFNPLGLVCTAFAGFILLDEKLYIGSIFGAILIVCGLYIMLWGQNKEMKKITQLVPVTISKTPESLQMVISPSSISDMPNNDSDVENCNRSLEKK